MSKPEKGTEQTMIENWATHEGKMNKLQKQMKNEHIKHRKNEETTEQMNKPLKIINEPWKEALGRNHERQQSKALKRNEQTTDENEQII